MDYKFRILTLKSGKQQLLMDFSPKSEILSSFVESEVASFGQEILMEIQKAMDLKEKVEFAGNATIAMIDPEYTRVESQFDDVFCILTTEEFINIVQAYINEKSKII